MSKSPLLADTRGARLDVCEIVGPDFPHHSSAYWWLMQEPGIRSFHVPWGSATRSIAVRAACPPDHPAVMVHFDPSVALDALDATIGDALATVEHRVVTNNGRAQFLLLWREAPVIVRELARFPHTALAH